MIQKTLLALFFLVVTSYLLPPHTHAIQEYSIEHHSTYTITQERKTLVQHLIKIKNNLSSLYPTSYTINLATNTIKNLHVQEDNTPIPAKITTSKTFTNINIKFQQPNLGKDKIKTLTISYENPSILSYSNLSAEINLPRLENYNNLVSYTRKLIVPKDFLQPTIFTPPPSSTESSVSSKTYIWNNTPSETISVLFGQYQPYQLDLLYSLNNPSLSPITKEIAIPPDTAYQRVFLQSLDPSPTKLITDQDGNWLAQYSLKPQETKTIKATLVVVVSPKPTLSLPFPPNLTALTRPTKYWDTSSTIVKNLSHQLHSPKLIYSYITQNFVYNYQKISQQKRLSASQALSTPTSAICTEFTDAFIALARAIGIPAREINGYAVTNNPKLKPFNFERDTLHAWPEYYDSKTKTWVQIDPTWTNTTGGIDYFSKLDFNHITFVKHGKNDSYPPPAGAYKLSPETKTIHVKPLSNLPKIKENLSIKETNNHFIVQNLGNTSLINKTIQLPNSQTYKITYLPPYAILSIPKKSPSPLPLPPKKTLSLFLSVTALTLFSLYLLRRLNMLY